MPAKPRMPRQTNGNIALPRRSGFTHSPPWRWAWFALALLSFPLTASARIGLADWSDTTPGGHQVDNFSSGVNLYLTHGREIHDVERWYFYKGHIVGTVDSDAEEPRYYAVKEQPVTVKQFTDEEEWDSYLTDEDLHPALWTRWHTGQWSITSDDVAMILVLGTFMLNPLVWLFWVLLFFFARTVYWAITREKLRLRHTNTKIVTVVSVLWATFWLLNVFPQSF